MKKLLIAGAVLTFGSVAMAAPTIYGQVNKSFNYYSWDSASDTGMGKTTHNLMEDVQNSETRLGVKGDFKFGETTAKYNIELGIDSTAADETAGDGTYGRIRIRMSTLDFVVPYGTFQFGYGFTATAKAFMGLDPLATTWAGLHGVDQKRLTLVAGGTGIGWDYRGRNELIKFTTNNMAGFTYSVSIDQDDWESASKGTSPCSATNCKTEYIENLLSYNNKFGGADLTLYFGYDMWNRAGIKDNTKMSAGFGAKIGAMDLSFVHTAKESSTDVATPVKTEDTYMMGTFAYTMGKNKFAATYGTHENKVTETKTDTQTALGYIRKYGDNLTVSLTYAMLNLEDKTLTPNTKLDHSVASLGMKLTF